MYDPLVGRFLEEDPIDFAPGDPNLFRYVGNSPTNATDPSGKYIIVKNKQDAEKLGKVIYNLTGLTLGQPVELANGQYIIREFSEPAQHRALHQALGANARSTRSPEVKEYVFHLLGPLVSDAKPYPGAVFVEAVHGDTPESVEYWRVSDDPKEGGRAHLDRLVLAKLNNQPNLLQARDSRWRVYPPWANGVYSASKPTESRPVHLYPPIRAKFSNTPHQLMKRTLTQLFDVRESIVNAIVELGYLSTDIGILGKRDWENIDGAALTPHGKKIFDRVEFFFKPDVGNHPIQVGDLRLLKHHYGKALKVLNSGALEIKYKLQLGDALAFATLPSSITFGSDWEQHPDPSGQVYTLLHEVMHLAGSHDDFGYWNVDYRPPGMAAGPPERCPTSKWVTWTGEGRERKLVPVVAKNKVQSFLRNDGYVGFIGQVGPGTPPDGLLLVSGYTKAYQQGSPRLVIVEHRV